MKKYFFGQLVCLLICLNVFATQQNEYNLLSAKDFVAPTYGGDSTSYVPDRVVGSIIYNASTGFFEGLGLDNSWHVFNTANPVTSTGTTERIDRGNLPKIGTTITSQSGNWTMAHLTGSGQYQINFAVAFSGVPTCIANSSEGNYTLVIASISASNVVIYSYNASSVPTDGAMNVICMGPK